VETILEKKLRADMQQVAEALAETATFCACSCSSWAVSFYHKLLNSFCVHRSAGSESEELRQNDSEFSRWTKWSAELLA